VAVPQLATVRAVLVVLVVVLLHQMELVQDKQTEIQVQQIWVVEVRVLSLIVVQQLAETEDLASLFCVTRTLSQSRSVQV
jgi:hypothetical protein